MRMIAASGFVLVTALVGPGFAAPAEAQSLTTPDGAIVITYTGVVTGDTFKGTVDLGGFAQAPYTGVRIKQCDALRD